MKGALQMLVVALAMLLGSPAVGEPQAVQPKGPDKPVESPKSKKKQATLTAQEREVLEQLELLQNLELLEKMDLVQDLPLLGGAGGDK
jgi:hypothetical protein